MQPIYVTQTSSGPGPWKLTNWHTTPPSFSWSTIANSTSVYQIEGTLDNPVLFGPNTGQNLAPGREGGMVNNPSSLAPNVFTISSAALSATSTSPTTYTSPLAAWRLNITTLSSVGASVTTTFLQQGLKQ